MKKKSRKRRAEKWALEITHSEAEVGGEGPGQDPGNPQEEGRALGDHVTHGRGKCQGEVSVALLMPRGSLWMGGAGKAWTKEQTAGFRGRVRILCQRADPSEEPRWTNFWGGRERGRGE